MTANQIAYWNLQETRRSNAIKENETRRSNEAKEQETHRSNLMKESEARKNRDLKQDELLDKFRTSRLQRKLAAAEFVTDTVKDAVGGKYSAREHMSDKLSDAFKLFVK